MTALTVPRRIVQRDGEGFDYPVKAAVTCLQGGLAILAAGYARPARAGQGANDTLKAADAAAYQVVGIFRETVVGGAADGDKKVRVKPGVYNFVNSAGADAVTLADVGKAAYVVDDQTVARTSAGGTRPEAGRIVDFDAEGVWVAVGPEARPGRRTLVLPFFINQTDLLAPTNAQLVCPVAGEIVRMSAIVQAAVTTGGDVTALVGTTAVAGLACTIADGATAGTVVTDTPTAGDASTKVAVGDRIQIAPGAPFATAGAVNGFIEIAF